MGKLFGTNGIRGIFGEDLTLEFIHDIVLSIATYFKNGPILVGYDGRESSLIIAKTVCTTLNYFGFDCGNAGLVPTPCLEFATKNLEYNGGIMITASHNPPKYNGIKPVANDGVEISREDELIIEDIYFNKKWNQNSSKYGSTKNEDIVDTYLSGIKSHIDHSKIKSKKFKIILDLGNGVQAITAPKLCHDLGCEVITINEKIDGMFPGRGSEPTPQNLSKLSELIIENNADLGVAFDGDGDRSIFCDNEGNILTGDKSALLFSKFILSKNPKSIIVTCLNSSSTIETLAAEYDSKVIRTKVGSVEVSRTMIPKNAIIGFEENGGFMFGKHNQVRDGAMTLALALDLLANNGKTMVDEMKNLSPSFTTKDKITCSKDDSIKIIDFLKSENPTSDITDGIKINFDPKEWVMVRPSGTEPIIRIYAESSSQEKLDNLILQYMNKIKLFLSR